MPDRDLSGIWAARPKMYKNTRINARKYEIHIYLSSSVLLPNLRYPKLLRDTRFLLAVVPPRSCPGGLFDIMTMDICDKG
jgi:hypothetical protein